jgi:hypothetical protein
MIFRALRRSTRGAAGVWAANQVKLGQGKHTASWLGSATKVTPLRPPPGEPPGPARRPGHSGCPPGGLLCTATSIYAGRLPAVFPGRLRLRLSGWRSFNLQGATAAIGSGCHLALASCWHLRLIRSAPKLTCSRAAPSICHAARHDSLRGERPVPAHHHQLPVRSVLSGASAAARRSLPRRSAGCHHSLRLRCAAPRSSPPPTGPSPPCSRGHVTR